MYIIQWLKCGWYGRKIWKTITEHCADLEIVDLVGTQMPKGLWLGGSMMRYHSYRDLCTLDQK